MTAPKEMCYCRKCGGPDGPGKLLAYSTCRTHARRDARIVVSPAFSSFLASASAAVNLQPGIAVASTSGSSALGVNLSNQDSDQDMQDIERYDKELSLDEVSLTSIDSCKL